MLTYCFPPIAVREVNVSGAIGGTFAGSFIVFGVLMILAICIVKKRNVKKSEQDHLEILR